MTITHVSENELALTKEVTRLTAELNAEMLFSKQAMASVLEIAAQRDLVQKDYDIYRDGVKVQYDKLRAELYESKHCQCGYDDVCQFAREADKLKAEIAACRKQALEEAASRSEAYSYMSQNFVALAEELRGMV